MLAILQAEKRMESLYQTMGEWAGRRVDQVSDVVYADQEQAAMWVSNP